MLLLRRVISIIIDSRAKIRIKTVIKSIKPQNQDLFSSIKNSKIVFD